MSKMVHYRYLLDEFYSLNINTASDPDTVSGSDAVGYPTLTTPKSYLAMLKTSYVIILIFFHGTQMCVILTHSGHDSFRQHG